MYIKTNYYQSKQENNQRLIKLLAGFERHSKDYVFIQLISREVCIITID